MKELNGSLTQEISPSSLQTKMDATGIIGEDFNKICRLCLTKNVSLTCLFSQGDNEMPLHLITQTCAAVDIDEEDGLPPNICCACRDTILFSYQFRQQVARNDTILRCVAGMKPDPDEEFPNQEADVTAMMEEKFWTAEDTTRETFGKLHDVKSIDDHPINGTPDETGEVSEVTRIKPDRDDEEAVLTVTVEENPPVVGNGDTGKLIGGNDKIMLRFLANMKSGSGDKGEKEEELEVSGTAERSNAIIFETNFNKTDAIQRQQTKTICNKNFNKNLLEYGEPKDFGATSEILCPTPRKMKNIQAKLLEYGAPTGDGGYRCKICDKVYRQFYRHIKFKHLQISLHFCDQCNYRTPSRLVLVQHIERQHNRPKKYKCSCCSLQFSSKQKMREHALTKNLADVTTDPECEKTKGLEYSNTKTTPEQEIGYNQRKQGEASPCIPGTKAEVRAILLEYGTPNSDGTSYHCKLCNKVYRRFYNHVKFKHLQLSAHYCNQCGYMAPTRGCLIQHIEGRHLRVKKYKCLQCPLGFTTKQYLFTHARAEGHKLKPSSNPEDPKRREIQQKMLECGTRLPGGGYHCKPCNKIYPQFYHHIKFTHLNIRNFICELCGYRAYMKNILADHIDGVHLRVRKHKCSDCPRGFRTRQKLNAHARTHRPGGITTFMCELCGTPFTSSNAHQELKRHMLSKHFPESKIKCESCDRAFLSRNHLKRHFLRIHKNT